MTTHDSSSQPARPATSPSGSPAPAAPTPAPAPAPDGDRSGDRSPLAGYGPQVHLHGRIDAMDVATAARACERCGVLVVYTLMHDDWHTRVSRLAAALLDDVSGS